MNMQRLAGGLALAAMLPLGAEAAPSVYFSAPRDGYTISGDLTQSSACEVRGSSIDRVRFYLDGRALNTEENSPYRCNLDTRQFSDGRHTLRAVAYDSRGASRSTQIDVTIRNGSSNSAPTVSFTAPAPGGPLSGNVQGPPHCIVTGTNIARVMFYINGTWTNTDGNLDNGLGCWIDTTRYRDGAYTLKAVAYNSAGQTATATRDIVIANSSGGSGSPTVSFMAPASGGTLSGNVQQSTSQCQVSGTGIARVVFFMDSTQLNTEQNAPYLCNVDTTRFSDGSHTLKAVAYDSAGRSSTVTRSVVIANDSAGGGDNGAPTVAFTAPAPGGPLSGNVQGPPHCIVTGSNIARVMFYINGVWTNTDGNLSNGLGCWIDTTKYRDGPYTLKAVAYNAKGQTATAMRDITIKNGGSTGSGPTVSFTRPTSGATVSGNLYQTSACEVKGSGIDKVQFYLGSTALNTELNAPYLCNFDTTKFANGSHTLMAVASNSSGSTTTQVAVKIDNQADSDPGDGDAAIDPADILNQARASVPFRDQRGYNTQVINKYMQAQDIPESGIHGSVLSNGESLRLGKQTDPRDSSRKALAFQVAPGDPLTSGSHRAEIKFPENMYYDKVYWIAFRHYVPDWGTFSTSDVAMIAMQLHTSGSPNSLSPAVQIDSRGGRTFWIDARGSTASVPSHSTSVSVRSPEMPIKFGQWVDFVLKVKLNTRGNGFVQAWVDGTQVFNHTGTVGYNGTRPYIKFGYYNWTSFKTPRKVLMRSPVVIADPTGHKYTADKVRSFIRNR